MENSKPKVWITGASGLLGSNCMSVFKDAGYPVLGSHYNFKTDDTVYFDTSDLENSKNYDILKYAPKLIIHCGALTHVDYCEQHPKESRLHNFTAVCNMLSLAESLNAYFVFISTDYVFDGIRGPYDEQCHPHPLSVYGRDKWEAELNVQNYDKHLVIRITNVYGDEVRGKNFVSRIIEQAIHKQRLQLNLPQDQYATPVNAYDVARAILLLFTHSATGIFHISGTDYMNRIQLALRILSYFPEAKYNLTAMWTDEMKQAARRPLQGGLKNSKFMTLFPDFVFGTVDEYVTNKIRSLRSR
jgi:dTDP-4-dehydrorhamnose reductase